MTSERIKQIQEETAYPESQSVQQALLKVWNECDQELAKERERAEKLVSDLDKLAEKYKAEGLYLSWAAIKQITGSYRNNLPPETTGNQTAC